MCCMLTTLVFFGPRLGILVWWLVRPVYVGSVLGDNWLFVLLLWAFLPWTVGWLRLGMADPGYTGRRSLLHGWILGQQRTSSRLRIEFS